MDMRTPESGSSGCGGEWYRREGTGTALTVPSVDKELRALNLKQVSMEAG